jgi:hypothetical protein
MEEPAIEEVCTLGGWFQRWLGSLSAILGIGEQGERASVEGMGCTLDEEHSTALFIRPLGEVAYNRFQPAFAGFTVRVG